MKRLPDWERRLVEYEESIRDRPFRWGAHDCASATVGAVEAITGEVLAYLLPAKRLRPFLTKAGALGAVARSKALRLGLDRCKPKTARRGDPVVVVVDGKECMSWIGSDGRAVALTWTGAVRVGADSIVAAWRVP